MNETEALVALNAICGLGNARILKLVEHYGTAEKIFSLNKSSFESDGVIPSYVADNILDFDKDKFIKSEFDALNSLGAKILTIFDSDYPENLKSIPDAPVVLYVKGEIPKTTDLSIAIVGSRKASIYGLNLAKEFATKLSESGFVVVSGLARGIDSSAHQGVLNARGRTIAVMGSGLANIYPKENKNLFEAISMSGAVISEYPLNTEPLAFNFPRRNRIISGLSLAVLIIEAAQKSGALITADCALEQGRDVFAIPGKIDSPTSKGVNELIKQGAKLVTCVEDIIEEINQEIVNLCANDKKEIKEFTNPGILDNLSESEKSLVENISKEPVSLEELIGLSKMELNLVTATLLKLEMRKLVRQLPGKMFVR